MSATAVRVLGAVIGAVTALAGGWVAGGWWWVAAGTGAVAVIGGLFDRHLTFVHVLVSLTLVAGVAGAGHGWYVVVLAAGTIGSIELAAAADRTSVVRRHVPDLARVAGTVPAVAALSVCILTVGGVSSGVPPLATVGAALAAVVAVRVVAR